MKILFAALLFTSVFAGSAFAGIVGDCNASTTPGGFWWKDLTLNVIENGVSRQVYKNTFNSNNGSDQASAYNECEAVRQDFISRGYAPLRPNPPVSAD